MNQPLSDKKTSRRSIARFTSGTLFGLFISVIYWSYSAYFHTSPPLVYSITGGLFLAIFCGAIATLISFDKLMELMDNFPSL